MPERIFSLILDYDSYPKEKHHQNLGMAAANKPNSLKLSKCFSEKNKPKMFSIIFNQRRNWTFIKLTNKKHEELKKIDIS